MSIHLNSASTFPHVRQFHGAAPSSPCPPAGEPVLDLARLEKVRQRGGRVVAACPACREMGRDGRGGHLTIFPSGRFACAAFQQDRAHARRVLELAGRPLNAGGGGSGGMGWNSSHPRGWQDRPAPRETRPLDWAADTGRLCLDRAAQARAAAWRGWWSPEYAERLAATGHLGLHGGRLCFPVRLEGGCGAVCGRHVFSWPEERAQGSAEAALEGGTPPKPDAWFAPAGVTPLTPLLLGLPMHPPAWPEQGVDCVRIMESQWDALAVLQAERWDGLALEAPVVVTRGASPTAALTQVLAALGVRAVEFWPQNDAPKADGSVPSQQWLQRCLDLLPPCVEAAWRMDTPAGFKDWNDALRGLELDEQEEMLLEAGREVRRARVHARIGEDASSHEASDEDGDFPCAQTGQEVRWALLPARIGEDASSHNPSFDQEDVRCAQNRQAGVPALLSQTGRAGVPTSLPQSWRAGVPAPLSQTGRAGVPTSLPQTGQAGVPASLPPPPPRPLPSSLAPVPAFDADRLLPVCLRHYVVDNAQRLQVDAAFVAVPLLVSLGAVLGNRLGLRPKSLDTWTEFPNVWGAIVGRPASLKSPALSAGLQPLHGLECAANQKHHQEMTRWKMDSAAARITLQAAQENARRSARKGEKFDAASLVPGAEEDAPRCRRFITNDASPEALHDLLTQPVNATGVLYFSDELCGLLCRLNDPDRGGALRAFMLSAWNGHMPVVLDRVGRGENLRVERACVSVLGGIQPGKLAPLVDGAVRESTQDDGWIQRLSLLVWPDVDPAYTWVDRAPDPDAQAEVRAIFQRAENTPGAAWAGAQVVEGARESSRSSRSSRSSGGDGVDGSGGDGEEPESHPHPQPHYLRFAPDACEVFREWMETETNLLRQSDLGAAFESHCLKYRKTVCALALLFHIAAEPDDDTVSLHCLVRALNWVDYLKAHAQRVYGSGENGTAEAARRILEKIRKGELAVPFRAREVKQREWAGLTLSSTVDAALEMLVCYGWLIGETEITSGGGRHTQRYLPHPETMKISA